MPGSTKDSDAVDGHYVPNQQRTRPMQVLALGFPRTGTASMALALQQLGFKHCAHGMDGLDNLQYAARWEQAVDAKYFHKGRPFTRNDFDEALGHCSAVADAPHIFFWRELYAAYPDVKVVLVQRDEDRWFRSFSEGVVDELYSPTGRFNRMFLEPLLGSRLGAMSVKTLEGFFQASDAEGIRANAIQMYRKHYDDVRATIPPESLLEYQLSDGWEPLCKFLGKDVPNTDFPWVNDAEALKEKIEEFKKKTAQGVQAMLLKRVVPAVAVGLVLFFAWREARPAL